MSDEQRSTGCKVAVYSQYRAAVLLIGKGRGVVASRSGEMITIFQHHGFLWDEPGQVQGEELLVFLRWNAREQRFETSGGAESMLPVRSGRVRTCLWPDTPLNGMKVEDFLARIRKLAGQRR